jgi:thymidylate kinase
MLIVFSGVDGAGKSTQIGLADTWFCSRGARTVRFWARGGYTPGFSLVKRLLRKSKSGGVPKPGASVERSKRFESKIVRRVWLTLAMLDLALCYAVWLRWSLWRGRTVLCDRYLEDTLLDFERNFPQEQVGSWFLWRWVVALAPRPACRFLLLVPPEVSAARGKFKNEPFPDSPETLAWRYARYQQLATGGAWCVVYCQHPVEVVFARIQEALEQCA